MSPPETPVERLALFCVRRSRTVVLAGALVALALFAGATRLTITNDMRAYFSEDNPQLAAFDAMEAVFDRQDNLYFLVVARTGDVFNREVLTLVWELTELGWQSPYSRRVTSLANYQHTYARGDELHVEALIQRPETLDAAGVARVEGIARAEPSLHRRILAADGSATGVLVSLTLPDGELTANDEVVRWARGELPALRARYPQADILLAGTTATNVALGEAVAGDIAGLVTLSYAVIVVGLLLLLRHLGGTLAVVLVVTLSIAATMGVFGWAGYTLEAVAGFVPSVVMTIAVADAVHILTTYYYELRRGTAKSAAIVESLRVNAPPVLITSLTTIIGVLTLNFSDSPPYRDLGNMVAVGVAVAYALSMTFLPALLAWAPIRHPARGRTLERWMTRFAETVLRRYRALLWTTGFGVLLVAAFIPRNQLTERWHEYFDRSFEVRRAMDALSERMGGLHVLRYALDSGRDQGIHDPAYLAAVDAFADWYRAQPGVSAVETVTDTLARLNMNLHGDDPAWRRLPESRELAAQYLLLYELSLPLGLGLDNIIDVGRSATQMAVFVDRADSETLLELDRRAQAWVREHAPALAPTEGTGVDMMFAHINHRNIRALLGGMALALALISLLLVAALRSVRLGLLSLLTNLAPAALAYGLWGMTVARIDLSASVVMCMSIGIVVDDTVHFLSKYLRARREHGAGAAAAIRYAFNTVGVALTITTAVLVAGFLVLAASHFDPTVTTGTLLALTLALALVVDFLLMPPLLIALERGREARG